MILLMVSEKRYLPERKAYVLRSRDMEHVCEQEVFQY